MNADPRSSSARRLRLALLAGLAVLAAPGGESPPPGEGGDEAGPALSHGAESAAVLPRAILSWPAPPSPASSGGPPSPSGGAWAHTAPGAAEAAARPLDTAPAPLPFFERVSYRTTAPPLPAA